MAQEVLRNLSPPPTTPPCPNPPGVSLELDLVLEGAVLPATSGVLGEGGGRGHCYHSSHAAVRGPVLAAGGLRALPLQLPSGPSARVGTSLQGRRGGKLLRVEVGQLSLLPPCSVPVLGRHLRNPASTSPSHHRLHVLPSCSRVTPDGGRTFRGLQVPVRAGS